MRVTDLIHNILVDEVTDSHELLRPFIICVSGTQFHGDCAAPCDLTKIVHAEIKKVPLPFYTALLTNFECQAINQNPSFRVIKLYYHALLLSTSDQPETKGSRKGRKRQGNRQSSLCVHYATIVCFVLKPCLPQLTIVSLRAKEIQAVSLS